MNAALAHPFVRHCDGPPSARWTLLLAHGAGADMDSPFMAEFTRRLIAHGEDCGGIRVVRFNFPYMNRRREDGRRRPPDRQPVLLESFRDEVTRLNSEGTPTGSLLIGGKSMGGRMASLLADELAVAGLICLGYPFHPPGKPERLRIEHLQRLTTPTLICQGERDSFGNRAEVSDYALSPAIRLHWLADGDHSFHPRRASGLTDADNLASAVTAVVEFIATF